MNRCVPNAPPPTADTNVPSTLAAAAGKAWRALLRNMTALPRFGAAEYQCPQYRRTGHYDALAEVTRRLGFLTVPPVFVDSSLVPFLCLFLVLVVTCNCLFKQLAMFCFRCTRQVYSYGLVLAELLTGRLQVRRALLTPFHPRRALSPAHRPLAEPFLHPLTPAALSHLLTGRLQVRYDPAPRQAAPCLPGPHANPCLTFLSCLSHPPAFVSPWRWLSTAAYIICSQTEERRRSGATRGPAAGPQTSPTPWPRSPGTLISHPSLCVCPSAHVADI